MNTDRSPRTRPRSRRRGAAVGAILLALVALLAASCSSDANSDGATTTTAPTPVTEPTTTDPVLGGSTTVPVTVPADRPIDVHVPPTIDDDTPAPLLVLLHGFGVNGEVQAAYLQLLPAVDARGMLFVAPDGTENQTGKRFWNATDACCALPNTEVDDSAYLAAVIAQVQADHNVDPNRIYVMGHSNGGFMSFRMACDHADVVAAVVSLEGATFADADACAPSEPVSTLAVHGRSDTTILFTGGKNGGRTYPSAETTAATWAAYNGCAPTPTAGDPATRAVVADLPPAVVTTYGDCDADTTSELWAQDQGVHIPRWDPTFIGQTLDWLLAHPKG